MACEVSLFDQRYEVPADAVSKTEPPKQKEAELSADIVGVAFGNMTTFLVIELEHP